MLQHIGQGDVAQLVHNAWLRTIEDGVHTYDIYSDATSKQKVGTQAFASAVVARLGQLPQKLKPVSYPTTSPTQASSDSVASATMSPAPGSRRGYG